MSNRCVLGLVAILCLTSCAPQDVDSSVAREPKVPTCLREICVEQATADSVEKLLGAGYAVSTRPFAFRCYKDSQDPHYLAVVSGALSPYTVEAILLTDRSPCKTAETAKKRLLEFATAEGIHLGSDKGDVIRAYGPPTLIATGDQWDRLGLDREQRDPMPFGDTIFRYFSGAKPESPSLAVYFRGGRVSSILLNAVPE